MAVDKLSDADTTKVRRDSGELEPFMLNITHSTEPPNTLPFNHLIGTNRQPNRELYRINVLEALGLSQ